MEHNGYGYRSVCTRRCERCSALPVALPRIELDRSPYWSEAFSGGAAGLLLTVPWPHLLGVVFAATMLGLVSSTVLVVAAAMVGSVDIRNRPLAYGIVFTWRDLDVIIAAVGANIIGLKLDLQAAFFSSHVYLSYAGCCQCA